jgi:lipoate synthase
MGKQKFNHDAESIEEAVGVNLDTLQEKLTSVVKDNTVRSQNIEAISKNFTKVELAVMFDQSLTMVHSLKHMLTSLGHDED